MAKKMETAAVSGLTADVYLEHRLRCNAAVVEHEEAGAKRMDAFKRAKKAGIDTKAMATVMKMARQDQDAVQIEQETIRRYAQWEKQAWATQGTLFTADDQPPSETASRQFDLATIEDEGRNASRNGHPRVETNPYDAGTEECAAFDRGYMAHQRVIADEMAANGDKTVTEIKKAKPRRGKGHPLETSPA